MEIPDGFGNLAGGRLPHRRVLRGARGALDSDTEEKVVDIFIFGTRSLLRFVKLVEDVEIGTIVMVLHTLKDPPVGHIVVLGPHNFQLCTC